MITTSDSHSTIDLGKYYAILPSDNAMVDEYKRKNIAFKYVRKGFQYNSGENDDFLSIAQIRELIKENINRSFMPV